MSDSDDGFFKDASIRVEKLSDWLNWSGGVNQNVFVALPMIQRGSVWKPNQIIDLWDTLLRGMPVGSLMAQTLHKGEKVRRVGGNILVDIPEGGGLSLLDGQQRTLSMLIPWEKQVRMDKKVWVDFGDKPQDEHLYRLRVTTENHPFGFQKASPSTRLSLGDRNKARIAFDAVHTTDKESTNAHIFEHSKPWASVLPVDLSELIALWKTHTKNKETWVAAVKEKLEKINASIASQAAVENRVCNFHQSLDRLFSLQIPIIEVSGEMLNVNEDEGNQIQDDIAPPLAVLFKRIGTGGTALTDADYVYSLIKYHLPEAYTLVEALHNNPNAASLLTATDLVMSAVRLAAAEFNDAQPAGKNGTFDWESPNKKQFHTLLKQDEDFLEKNLKPLIEVDAQGHGALVDAFNTLSKLLYYQQNSHDIGLPKYAFPLLKRPLVQVLLRWIRLVQLRHPNEAENVYKNNRKNILRFVLYWRVFVLETKEASALAFKVLAEDKFSNVFPDKIIYEKLQEKELAIAITNPESIKHIAFSAEETLLRGWRRFEITKETSVAEKNRIELYQRWWGHGGHVHPILLWLQRDFVSKFDGDPMAGRDEETPYDYDHICPSSHWYNNSKSDKSRNRIIDHFAVGDSGGHWRVGNCIGNLRVWGSSDNRSDCDDSPAEKILNRESSTILLESSAIKKEHSEFWLRCSGEEGKGKIWTKERAQAFQRAVEHRAFALYENYYQDLGFEVWLANE